ncbi:type II toxin-antitoxin system RelB/DinJ family antitoxin [Bifidobacterium panos]|uniref:RelB antitoxin n=1 Tax=Bifidobacterium panos TaxID=2675321 RepID=A0ABX1SWW0_9BIFI|nr:type II toxin-antitoxin system RelB/DinJ family antitoxin [Bifidobacterium sp. DSM 109963]NMN02325.1 RelB antitoxin [Bifidobacterium sp. DSM 109963]
MAMVTARVDADRKREAEDVLKRNGRTYSDLIRDLTDYIADTGELPEFERTMLELLARHEMKRKLQILEYFANRELPEVEGGLSDEELIEQERARRAGDMR